MFTWIREEILTLSLQQTFIALVALTACQCSSFLWMNSAHAWETQGTVAVHTPRYSNTTDAVKPPLPTLPEQSSAQADEDDLSDSIRVISSTIRTYNKTLSHDEVSQINQGIHLCSSYFDLDPHLLASLLAVESSFRPAAISRTGAIGLGQLKPKTAQWLGVRNPYDPIENMFGAAKYLRYLMDKYNNNTSYALAAYYKGQGHIDREGIDSDAMYYVGKIDRVYRTIKQEPLP